MDKTWIKHSVQFSDKQTRGIEDFLEYVRAHCGDKDVLCPCRECLNVDMRSQQEVHDHLYMYSMSVTYTNWIHHGEAHDAPGVITDPPEDDHHVADEGSIENEGFSILENMY